MKDDAGRDARLVLRRAVQPGVDAIDLKNSNGEERSHMPVDSAAERTGPRGILAKAEKRRGRDGVLRFPGETNQSMHKGRVFERQRDLRTSQLAVLARAGAFGFAVRTIEIHDSAKE